MSSTDTLTFSTSYWRIPSPERAFDGWLEGRPTGEQRHLIIEAAKAARQSWKPSPEAHAQVEQLKSFIGSRVNIQLWDPCMWLLDSDGPFPFFANCIDVKILQDGEFPQAYLLLENVIEIPNADGYSPDPYFQQRADCNYLHASVADLYQVSKVVTP